MKERNFDFEKYLKWCGEKGVYASESSSLEEYKREMSKASQNAEKMEKIASQKEIFEAICKLVGKKVKYPEDDEVCFDFINNVLEALLFAIEMGNVRKEIENKVEKAMNKFELGKEEEAND